MSKHKYYPPCFGEEAFHCAICKVYSSQQWFEMIKYSADYSIVLQQVERVSYIKSKSELASNHALSINKCGHCGDHSIWKDGTMVYPDSVNIESPNSDMPSNVKEIYNEAALPIIRIESREILTFLFNPF